ncbi:hypothetical protein MAM1_0039d02793 [Mucor ambiguus]|uniref:Uncharacterized protein n=1 Tax=Mucor ambiguus TaxID=91626 RepID=A0A0C9LT34_9FUNG|nr:hypothetical protein MAM1_0039d02793 [Mucor ambiguus]
MRFNILSLGLVATVVMSAFVRAIPFAEAIDGANKSIGNTGTGDSDLLNRVARHDINGGPTDGDLTGDVRDLGQSIPDDPEAGAESIADTALGCSLGNGLKKAIGCVTATSNSGATANNKRSSRLSRRQLLQRRAEAATTTDATADPPDDDDVEKEENFVRRKTSEDGDEKDEEKDKEKRERSVNGEVDEKEADEQEPEEEELDENEVEDDGIEVEPDEEDADELGDAEPAGRR